MNSYQRRQQKRRMIFGLRKLAKAAAKAGARIQMMAQCIPRLTEALAAFKKPV